MPGTYCLSCGEMEENGIWEGGAPDRWAVSLAGGLLAPRTQDIQYVSTTQFLDLSCCFNQCLFAK